MPRWLFLVGASTALIVSFVALSTLWAEPRFEGRPLPHARPSRLQAILTNTTIEWTVRILMLVAFLVVALASARPASPTETIGPIVVYAWFWVGLTIAHALFGNLWATLSPFDTLGRIIGLDEREGTPPREYPKEWGKWPAAVFLFAFVWIELVDPFAAIPGSLGIAIVAYTLIQVVGMHVFGRRAWIENAEAFGVYLGLVARISPLVRDERGRVVVRPPLAGLAEVAPQPGLIAVIMVALGSTTFDGISRTESWVIWTGRLGGFSRISALNALALLAVIGLVAGAYALSMAAAARVVGGRWHPLAVRFVHSLVPIVLAYVVAHYFSFLVLEGQLGLVRLSDPFGAGWDLFGTADWAVNYTLISPTTIWYVQVAAIVIGHVGGVILAHDRAVAMFDRDEAVRTQYALLAVMIVFTTIGLLILSG